jgi:RNA 3'-terminal phosphate cyclase (ATP)
LPSEIDIGSPGSITLVFQALLPFLLFASTSKDDSPPSLHLTIKGGTNVSNSPSYDYVHQVLLPTLSMIGLPPITARLNARGWNTGRPEVGSVTFTVQPLSKGATMPAFELKERGNVVSVQATVLAPRAVEKDFQREIRAEVRRILPAVEDVKVDFELSGHQKRLYVLLVATTSTGCRLGRDWLYMQRITSLSAAVSEMVKRVVNDLDAEIRGDGCVDEHMSDQLVVFQALAKGRSMIRGKKEEDGSVSESTLHAQTAWWVVSELLGVDVDGEGVCEGVGFVVGDEFVATKKKEETDEIREE